jgi:hypothetical protein
MTCDYKPDGPADMAVKNLEALDARPASPRNCNPSPHSDRAHCFPSPTALGLIRFFATALGIAQPHDVNLRHRNYLMTNLGQSAATFKENYSPVATGQ